MSITAQEKTINYIVNLMQEDKLSKDFGEKLIYNIYALGRVPETFILPEEDFAELMRQFPPQEGGYLLYQLDTGAHIITFERLPQDIWISR